MIPRQTMLIENPIAVAEEERATRPSRTPFSRFLRTPAAQKIFAENGYRPVDQERARASSRRSSRSAPGKFTIDELGLGGWAKVDKKWFSTRRRASWPRIERQVGGDRLAALTRLSRRRAAGADRGRRGRATTALSLGFVTTYLT